MTDALDRWLRRLVELQRAKREEALRRLQDVVHLQTVVQAWAVGAGILGRDGDPLCGASGGQMVRAEARVTCRACRTLMENEPRA